MGECCGCGKTLDVAAMQARHRRVLWIVLLINLATFLMMVGASCTAIRPRCSPVRWTTWAMRRPIC